MKIRRLNLQDAPAVFALRLKALATAPTAFGSSVEDDQLRGLPFFESLLASTGDNTLILGAFENEVLGGMVGLMQTNRIKTKHKADIWGMFVDQAFRGKGAASALLDFAIAHAKQKMNVTGVYLSVESTNTIAKNLYLSRAFKVWGQEPKALFVNGKYYEETHLALEF